MKAKMRAMEITEERLLKRVSHLEKINSKLNIENQSLSESLDKVMVSQKGNLTFCDRFNALFFPSKAKKQKNKELSKDFFGNESVKIKFEEGSTTENFDTVTFSSSK